MLNYLTHILRFCNNALFLKKNFSLKNHGSEIFFKICAERRYSISSHFAIINKIIQNGCKYMIKDEQDKITHEIIGCAIEVHKTLGNGFQEVIYQQKI